MHVFTLTRSAEEWASYAPPAIFLLAILLLAILLLAILLLHAFQGPFPEVQRNEQATTSSEEILPHFLLLYLLL
jgi:hypothetical protein